MRDVILYCKAISNLIPGVGFHLNGDDYSSLKIIGETKPPKEKEIEEEYQKLLQEYDSKEYQRLREPEYPNLADFVDAYYWSQKGDNTKMKEYIVKCDEVKNKYPKVTD